MRARGFTLVELLVVLAIIGVLLGIALPRYFGSEDRAKEAVLKENLYRMREAIQHYYADKGKYPEQLEALAAEKYLRAVPLDLLQGHETRGIAVRSGNRYRYLKLNPTY